MRRHEFIALPSRAAVEWPLAARAQPATRLRLGLYSRLSVGGTSRCGCCVARRGLVTVRSHV